MLYDGFLGTYVVLGMTVVSGKDKQLVADQSLCFLCCWSAEIAGFSARGEDRFHSPRWKRSNFGGSNCLESYLDLIGD